MGSRARHRGRRPGALGWTALAVVALCVAGFALTARQSDGGRSTAGVRTPQSTAATSPPAAPAATATPTPSPARDTPTPSATRTAGPTTQSAKSARSPKVTAAPPKLAAKSGTRVFSFVNGLRQTVWLASGEQTATPALSTTGWVLRPGRTLSVRVPDHWNGRFWGRTGCTFDSAGHGHCATGACDSRFQCAGYGAIPATLAEFNLNSWDGMDFYDVSLVDGSNLPMYINLVGGATRTRSPHTAAPGPAVRTSSTARPPSASRATPASHPAVYSTPTSTAVARNGPRVPNAAPTSGPSTTRRPSRRPSLSPIPTWTTTRPALSPAVARPATASPSPPAPDDPHPARRFADSLRTAPCLAP